MVTRLCVLGAFGRTGREVLQLALRKPDIEVVSVGYRAAGRPVPGCDLLTETLEDAIPKADVYVDFTTPEVSCRGAAIALEHKVIAVVGTTGLDSAAQSALAVLATVAPIMIAANFSPGVVMMCHLAEQAARALGPDYDLEVLELHHRNKVDAPSGTALSLGRSMATGRGLDFTAALTTSRSGQVGPRPAGEIGIQAMRGGDIVGEHTAYFVSGEERLEISHRSQTRSVYAAGALRAAQWLRSQPPGTFEMTDLLGL